MSLHVNFEPHSWYMGFAIRKTFDRYAFTCDSRHHDRQCNNPVGECCKDCFNWEAYTDDGNTYSIVTLEANTLKDLKLQIRNYWRKQGSVYYNNRMRREN